MLFIRADANEQVGLGHMMRCLTIAEAADRAGIETVFFVADGKAEALLQERGRQYRILHTKFDDMESELPALFPLLDEWISKSHEKSVLLVDSYRATSLYMERLWEWTRTCAVPAALARMEDYGGNPHRVDVLINYNIYGPDFFYGDHTAKALLGCRYVPLRKEFTGQAFAIREKVKHILITAGGSDPYRIGEELAGRLGMREEISLHIVCGKFSESEKNIRAMGKTYKNLNVYKDVEKMWELMASCDMAISASGTTLYELCAIGVPTICFSFADNQILPGETFGKKTPMFYAGDYEKDRDAMYAEILQKTEEWIRMPGEGRAKISEGLRKITDGKGADRIIGELFP